MLIKLTALAHPDINGGQPWPVYIDATRIISISRAVHQHIKLLNADVKREAADDLYGHVQRLNNFLAEKWPTAIDTSDAAEWAKKIHRAAHEVGEAYQAWSRSWRAEDLHPRVECTEIQLACGTALEHGVMLARHWVTEDPDKIAELVELKRKLAVNEAILGARP